jgi:type IV secretion system protein VirB9
MKVFALISLFAGAVAGIASAPAAPSGRTIASDGSPKPVALRIARRSHPQMSVAEWRVGAANRAATLEPTAASSIDAVQVYPFAEGAVYHLLAAPGQVTDIALQPGEALGAVAAGDTARWVIGDTSSGSGDSKRTHVLVKPVAAGLSTNIIITTDRRTYHLALTSADHVAMVALSWTYPQDVLIAFKAAQERAVAAQPVAAGLQLDQLHFNYVISGDQPAWRPLRAFDDGRQTFVEFSPSLAVGEAPPLFLVDAKGNAVLVNYRVHGRFYIVDRLFDAAELRLGLKHQDVVRITRVADNDQGRAS